MDNIGQLEFDKIKAILSSYCFSNKAKQRAKTLEILSGKTEIDYSLSIISDCQEICQKGFGFNFEMIEDLEQILYQFQFRSYSYEEFKSVYQTVSKSLEIIRFLSKEELFLEETPHFVVLCNKLVPLTDIKTRFEEIFLPDGEVSDNASPLLRHVRRRQTSLRNTILRHLERKLNEKRLDNIIQDKIITQREGRYVIPLKDGGTSSVQGIVHGYSGSKATIFVEPNDVVGQNNELHALKREEDDEIYRIFCDYTDTIIAEKEVIFSNNKVVCDLDYYFACSTMCNKLRASKPVLIPQYKIKLSNARHPLLIYNYESYEEVIPFNLNLGEQEKILVLSGPNTGGKTITLKTVGLLTMMTLCGLPIPADSNSEIGLFAHVFTDISDNQSIENSLSTFSSHIEKIKEMVQQGNEKSLVLIDEIGSATDPEQGAALAQSILEKLVDLNVLGIVTTHYTPLKIFAEQSDNCINAAMQFDPEQHRPTYRFEVGIPGNSFAIEIAERLGLEEKLLTRAKQLTGEKSIELNSLISTISKEKKELARAKYEVELKQKLMEIKANEYSTLINEIDSQKKEIRLKALTEAKAYLTQTQQEINQELQKVKQQDKRKQKEQVKKVINTISEKQQNIFREENDLSNKEYLPVKDLKLGEQVWVKEFTSLGTVVSIEKDKATVDINGFFFTTGKSNLFKVRDKDSKAVTKGNVINRQTEKKRQVNYDSPEIKTEIKLLGMTFEEALPLIERFIDDGYYAGLKKLRIVHGKGTGALRKKVRSYLQGINNVSEFYSPPSEMGGEGVTIVEFR